MFGRAILNLNHPQSIFLTIECVWSLVALRKETTVADVVILRINHAYDLLYVILVPRNQLLIIKYFQISKY